MASGVGIDFVKGREKRRDMSDLEAFSRQHKALGDPSRIRIIRLLRAEKSLCVCEIEAALGLPQYGVSRHLGVLRQAGFVQGWREGTWMHYRFAEGLPKAWLNAIDSLCSLWDTDKVIRRDLKKFKKGC